MEKVLIEVIGTQNIDSQFDKTELKTVGTFEELEEKYIIRYKEEQGEGEAPVDVSVVVLKDESVVEMTRDGAISSRLVIERSQRNLCHYGTATAIYLWAFRAIQLSMSQMKTAANSHLDMILISTVPLLPKIVLSLHIKRKSNLNNRSK